MPDTEKLNIHQKILKILPTQPAVSKKTQKRALTTGNVPERRKFRPKVTACMQK